MSFSTGTKGLRAKLKRVEDLIGKGQRNCPSCRLLLRRPWPHTDRRKPKAPEEDLVNAQCKLCDAKYILYISKIPKEERDAWRAWFSASLEFWYLNPECTPSIYG